MRYFGWASQVVQGQLGYSRQYKIPVQNLVLPRLQNTLILSVPALVIALSVALLLGIVSAVKQYSLIDYSSMGFAFFGFSVPGFWLGLMLIVLFSVNLRWLPPGGIMSSEVGPGLWAQVTDRAKYLVAPVIVTAFTEMAAWTRYTRNRRRPLRRDRSTHPVRLTRPDCPGCNRARSTNPAARAGGTAVPPYS